MAITTALCTSFKAEALNGTHVVADTYKVALYLSSATLSAATTVYTTTGEVSGTGYTAGGKALTNVNIVTAGTTVIWTADDLVWAAASITARGALIYNATKGNKAVATIDFGADKTSTDDNWTFDILAADAVTGFIKWN